MIAFHQIRNVHLEVTDKCNAGCPMCPRTENGGPLNPKLRNIEMSLDLARKTFPEEFLKQLNFIQLCGNFGDPIAASETLDILKYFRSVNPSISLGVHTNGSLRNTSWWAALGEILKGPSDYCKFALDGLADTNHLYRRFTQWSKIIENAKAFIAAGGQAHWEYLVFAHNQHQVEEARELSQTMGFTKFFLKKTSRFFNYRSGKNEPYPIFDKSRNTIGYLNPPEDKTLINKVTLQESPPEEKNQTFERQINCMTVREKSIYISAAGEVFPCCFIGGQVQYQDGGRDAELLIQMAKKSSGQGISTQQSSPQDILKSDWFSEIKKTWSTTDSESSLGVCHRLCTEERLIVKGEYE